jgi:hypothetical protein
MSNVPGWLKDAIATPRGFIGKKGELLKAQRMTAQECDEFNNRFREEPKTITLDISTPVPTVSVEPTVEIVEEPVEEEVQVEEESTNTMVDTHGEIEITVTGADKDGDGVLDAEELKALTKAKLESIARDYGLELDRRMSKKKLLEKLLDHIAE